MIDLVSIQRDTQYPKKNINVGIPSLKKIYIYIYLQKY